MARTKTVSTIPYQKNGYDLKIPLKLVTEDAGYRGSAPKLSYRIDLEHPTELHLAGTDPQVLADKLIAEIDKVCAVTWEPWLVVHTKSEVGSRRSCSEPGWESEISISVGFILIGTNTEGTQQHVTYDGIRGPDIRAAETRGNWRRQGLPTTGYQPKWGGNDNGPDLGCNTALVRDTPENRAKLKALTEMIGKVGVQIAAFLSPERIETVLRGPGIAFSTKTEAET